MTARRTAVLERPTARKTDPIKVGILAADSTHLGEGTDLRPKPMAEIGGRPILWHVMKHFAHYGYKDFVVARGSEGNLSVDLSDGSVHRDGASGFDWRVELIDAGLDTMTGGRIKRLRPHFGGGAFMLARCNSVSDVDLDALLAFHRAHGKLATVTAVRPPARFGKLQLAGDKVVEFAEKPLWGDGWVNGGYCVLEPGVFDYIEDSDTQWERGPIERLAADGQLMAHKHHSFWQALDTLGDKRLLESLWQSGTAPWKTWE